MKISKFLFVTTLLCGIAFKASAADLMDVYQDALASDPAFKAAKTEWLAAKEALAVSRSALLPQIIAEGSITRRRNNGDSFNSSGQKVNSTYYISASGYSL